MIPHNPDGTINKYCTLHRCMSCKNAEKCDKSNYCSYCVCHYEKCPDPHIKDSKFCQHHIGLICHYKHCQKPRVDWSNFCQKHSCVFHKCGHHLYEYSDEDGGYRSDFCIKHDLLNHLCKQYGFTLMDQEFLNIVDQSSLVNKSDDISEQSPQTEVKKFIKFALASKALLICDK
jgi:hypothetical protein